MSKREISASLQSILNLDRSITNTLCSLADRFHATRSLKRHSKTLEYSCHGILWLVGWLLFTWIFWIPSLFQMQVNFFIVVVYIIGLILDIIFVAVIKAITRRRRPIGNRNDTFTLGPDKYSFPSGHVSRSFFIVYFFIKLYPLNIIFFPAMIAWCVSISFSRILLRRHHLLDVLAGALLGMLEGLVISFIWLNNATASGIIQWITDEKFDGGEYHV